MENNIHLLLKKNKKTIFFCIMLVISMIIITFRMYRIQLVFSHIAYILIVLACFQFGKKGIWVSVCLAVFYVLSWIFLKLGQEQIFCDLLQAVVYIIIAWVVGALREESLKNKKIISETKYSEEKYRQFFEFIPEGIICFSQDRILHVNKTLVKILKGENKDEILNKSMQELFKDDFFSNQNMSNLIKSKKIECQVQRLDDCIIDVEISSVALDFGELNVYMLVIRDITEQKKELKRASRIQKERLITPFTHPEKALVKLIYRPLSAVSGDFIFFHHTDKDIATGMIGDVSGKGLHAALSCLALKMLFLDAVEEINNPKEILIHMNQRMEKDLEDEHAAVLCFRIDFAKRKMRVASAGINKFFHAHKNNSFAEIVIKGPFLGMIGSEHFEEKDIDFQAGDIIYLYTDGLEDFFLDLNILKDCQKLQSINEQKKYITNLINRKYIYDDCSWIGIQIL